jgi:hypothetical protein
MGMSVSETPAPFVAIFECATGIGIDLAIAFAIGF